jgi:hypothetical protein
LTLPLTIAVQVHVAVAVKVHVHNHAHRDDHADARLRDASVAREVAGIHDEHRRWL